MRKVILSTFITLDGFTSGPNGELDWMPGSKDHPDTEVDSCIFRMLDDVDTILLGSATYELFVEFWPTATTKEEIIADKLNAIPKLVFSRTLDKVGWGKWGNARLAKGTLSDEIIGLKRQPGKNMVMFGSASLARSCMELGLIDDYQLFVAPIILGNGKPLFKGTKDKVDLRLANFKKFESGVVLLSYNPKS